ncbi:hypothetical protein [Staphylococcus xylosus]
MDFYAMDVILTKMLMDSIEKKSNVNELKTLSITLNNKMDDINNVIDKRIYELEDK